MSIINRLHDAVMALDYSGASNETIDMAFSELLKERGNAPDWKAAKEYDCDAYLFPIACAVREFGVDELVEKVTDGEVSLFTAIGLILGCEPAEQKAAVAKGTAEIKKRSWPGKYGFRGEATTTSSNKALQLNLFD